MGLLKKSAAPAEPFVVPSLEDTSPEYSRLLEQRATLIAEDGSLREEAERLYETIRTMPAPKIPLAVAEKLGDVVEDSKAKLVARHREIERERAVIAQALEEIRKRLNDERTRASVAVCEIVKPEFARRVAEICDGLKAVHTARMAYVELVDALNAEDIAWTRLGSVGLGFLGDHLDGHVQRVIKEATREGNYNG